MIQVLFVCMGNICRSPTAQVIFDHWVEQAGLIAQINSDSAGTVGFRVGSGPDPRVVAVAQKHGMKMEHLLARQISLQDFHAFDYIVAMDQQNFDHLMALCPENSRQKISLLLSHIKDGKEREVHDPYYGGERSFEMMFKIITEGVKALLADIRKEHQL